MRLCIQVKLLKRKNKDYAGRGIKECWNDTNTSCRAPELESTFREIARDADIYKDHGPLDEDPEEFWRVSNSENIYVVPNYSYTRDMDIFG